MAYHSSDVLYIFDFPSDLFSSFRSYLILGHTWRYVIHIARRGQVYDYFPKRFRLHVNLRCLWAPSIQSLPHKFRYKGVWHFHDNTVLIVSTMEWTIALQISRHSSPWKHVVHWTVQTFTLSIITIPRSFMNAGDVFVHAWLEHVSKRNIKSRKYRYWNIIWNWTSIGQREFLIRFSRKQIPATTQNFCHLFLWISETDHLRH